MPLASLALGAHVALLQCVTSCQCGGGVLCSPPWLSEQDCRKPLSCLRLHRLFDSVAAQQGMHATDPIDNLRDAQVHDQTGERQGLPGRETVQLAHQLDHLDGCDSPPLRPESG